MQPIQVYSLPLSFPETTLKNFLFLSFLVCFLIFWIKHKPRSSNNPQQVETEDMKENARKWREEVEKCTYEIAETCPSCMVWEGAALLALFLPFLSVSLSLFFFFSKTQWTKESNYGEWSMKNNIRSVLRLESPMCWSLLVFIEKKKREAVISVYLAAAAATVIWVGHPWWSKLNAFSAVQILCHVNSGFSMNY